LLYTFLTGAKLALFANDESTISRHNRATGRTLEAVAMKSFYSMIFSFSNHSVPPFMIWIAAVTSERM
jgi:hypothetical protein